MKTILTALLAIPLLTGYAAAADTLRIGGSGGAIGTLKHLGAAFAADSGTKVTVVPSLGSTGGIRAVGDGVLDIGVSARLLEPEEAATGLVQVEVARSPFGLVTSHRSPNGLKSAEIAAIFKSEKPLWADGTPIRIILRPKGDSDIALLVASFPGMSAALEQARRRPDVPLAANDQDNCDLAERMAGSLTGSLLAQIMTEKRDLRFVAIDGVEPTLANFEKGTYPYAWTMYLVFPAKKSPAAERFLAFVRSPQGQNLLRETGNLPNPN
jgi:phosphate transport system substrate-binding protein